MYTKTVSRHLILVGAIQGVLLCWLWKAHELAWWPATNAMWLGFFLWASLSVPFAIYLTSDTGMNRTLRIKVCALAGVFFSAIGVYAGWTEAPLEVVERAYPPASFAQATASVLLAFMLVPLIAAWRRERKGWDYPQLFEIAWRNAFLCAAVVVLTGIFWGVLFTGAELMNSLGVTFFKELFDEEVFAIPVTGTVVGAVFAVALARANWLVHVRHFWLALNAWLLPLLLFFGVMWVLAIPANGLEKLFATKNAAFFLLWFSVLAVKFSNAAWQDGREEPVYPRWLARVLSLAWLCMLVVSGVAIFALSLRVKQYGWTQDRLWACVIALIAVMYAVGFSVSVFWKAPSGRWLWSIGKTNIVVALVACVLLALLISPLADPRRISVNSQLARLHTGEVKPEEFDYRHLRWESGQWGLRGLQTLAGNRSDAVAIAIADRAQLALAQQDRWDYTSRAITNEALARRLTVLPSTRTLPDTLLAQLQTRDGISWELNRCKLANNDCTVWLSDFNGDQKEEALIVIRDGGGDSPCVILLSQPRAEWQVVANYQTTLSYEKLVASIATGQTQFVTPVWPDLKLGDQQLQVRQQ